MKISKFNYTDDWPISFSQPFFHYLNTNIQGEYTVVEHDNIFLPLIIKNKYRFKIGYFIHVPLENGKKLSLETEQKFFTKILSFLKKYKIVDFIFPLLSIENFQHLPKGSEGSKLSIIKLSLKNKSEEDVFASFNIKYRNVIRKAINEGVMVKSGIEYFDDFYKLYQAKLILENIPYSSYNQLKSLITDSNLNKTRSATCVVAYMNNIPDAGILNLNDNNNAYNMCAATHSKSHQGSLRLLHWELIKQYLKMGIINYCMGGERQDVYLNGKDSRLLKFKLGFGCIINEGYHFTLIINPLKFKLYNQLLNLKLKIVNPLKLNNELFNIKSKGGKSKDV